MADINESATSRAAAIEDGFALLARLFLAGLFIYSAWHKIGDPVSFQIKVNEYDILPVSWEELFAIVLPWAMVISSGLLIIGFLTRAASGTQALMLVSFIVAISVNVYRDKVLGCGCFSEEGHQIGPLLVFQDFLLLAVTSYLMVRGGRRFSVDALMPWKKFF
jgi:uncharacterized membrane protein YphA (DoxX/SURF4 family)